MSTKKSRFNLAAPDSGRFVLETKLGKLAIIPCGFNECRVTGHRPGGTHMTLDVDSVKVSLSQCCLVFEKGEWRTAYREGTQTPADWVIERLGNPTTEGWREAGVSQIKAVKYAVLEAVTAWASENRPAFEAAERRKLEEHVKDCEADVERAQEVLDGETEALDKAQRLKANFDVVHPEKDDFTRFPVGRALKLTSTAMCHTPSLFRWAQNAFRSDPVVAVKVFTEGYDLQRIEAVGILSGEIPVEFTKDDAVTFTTPYRNGSKD